MQECVSRVPPGVGTADATDQHVLLWVEHQLPAPSCRLLTLLLPVRGPGPGAARPLLRNGEGLGDQEPEVVRDFCGVGQLQVVGGHQLAQHLATAGRGDSDREALPLEGWWGAPG